ncbi:MAG: cytochrome c3 family protein [Candidatus Hydrothermales bacterium]
MLIIFLISQERDCTERGCHDILIEERVLHQPVKEDCSLCHNLEGEHPFKKIENINSICLNCHENKSKFKHPPNDNKCTHCHNPHSSPLNFLLREKLPYLCSSCHKELSKTALSFHAPFVDGKCKSCHDVHGNDKRSYLLRETNSLCFDCHKEMEEQYRVKKYKHPPIENCITCHNPHQSNFTMLLNSMYPNKPYVFFTHLQYELCFNCHNLEDLFSEKSSFKRGEENLHKVHVKREKGIVCSFCHNPHFSKNFALVEGGKKFGPYNYVLNFDFIKTEKKGTCGPACHGKAEY